MNIERMTLEQIKHVFSEYKGMLVEYAKDHEATIDLNLLHTMLKIANLDEIYGLLFMIYISKYWHAYTMDIIEGKYVYINYTDMVYNSFIEYMAH